MTTGSGTGSHGSDARRLRVWLVDLAAQASQRAAWDDAQGTLSEDERQRAAAMSPEARRALWVASRVSLRWALEDFCDTRLDGRAFAMATGGKPFLPPPFPHFSLSHSGTLALIALADPALGPLGVDLEVVRPRKISAERALQIEALAERIAGGAALPDAQSEDGHAGRHAPARFIQAWCRVEAIAKADGRGVARLLAEAGVLGPGSRARRQSSTLSAASPAEGALVSVVAARDLDLADMAPGYAAAIALAPQGAPEVITVRRFPSLSLWPR